MATNECDKELISIRLRATDIGMTNALTLITIYSNNQAWVDWSSSITNEGNKNINLRENKVREAQADEKIFVTHIPGVINSSNIFTKEMKDAAHYCQLRNTITVSRTNFMRFHHTVPSHLIT